MTQIRQLWGKPTRVETDDFCSCSFHTSFTLVSDKKYHLYPVLVTLTKQHLWVCVFFVCLFVFFFFSFLFFLLQANQVSILQNSPLFSTSPEYYFGMVIKTNKINYYAKCLPLCKINYIQYNASHITFYLCSTILKNKTKQNQKQTYQWEQKPKRKGETWEGIEERQRVQEISKT